jgi:hypothetical protein
LSADVAAASQVLGAGLLAESVIAATSTPNATVIADVHRIARPSRHWVEIDWRTVFAAADRCQPTSAVSL